VVTILLGAVFPPRGLEPEETRNSDAVIHELTEHEVQIALD
jgi:hypothetical protein